jgi:rhodanese-related sulfurtransferase
VAARLVEHGFETVRPLAGGFDAWVERGYPVESPKVESHA